jgi:enoyl-[acyl-carrier-protein] reductase (NADH)
MYDEECTRNAEPLYMIEKASALKRPIEPDEVASTCLYLCSPSTVAMNGFFLAMDIGILTGMN